MAAGAEAVALAGPHVRRLISSDSVPAGGFTPGTILLGRYRIIGLLGRGGMGEVYRADDLKLGQAVALKFLPPALAEDPVRRERFFAEVRITRQVSHPNICRVYDIAELEDPISKQPRYFLTMEYIDGEDLASLLQRIGYLSNDKANDIARQLVAGLASAHDRGVLHRDLKPANIILDGQGRPGHRYLHSAGRCRVNSRLGADRPAARAAESVRRRNDSPARRAQRVGHEMMRDAIAVREPGTRNPRASLFAASPT
jgi:serine/threonine protein kinase